MPTLPRIERRVPVPSLELPRPGPESFGAGIGKGLGELGGSLDKIAEESRKQQDALDFATFSGEYDAALEDLKEEIKAEPDYEKRPKLYSEKALDLQKTYLERDQSQAVKNALQTHFARTLPKQMIEVKVESLKEWNSSRLAELDQVEDVLAGRIISAPDDAEAQRLKGLHSGLVRGISVGPYAALRPEQAQKRIENFEIKVTAKRADAALRADPEDFLAREQAGEFGRLDQSVRTKLVEQAMQRSEQQAKRVDQLHDKIRKGQFSTLAGLANEGRLTMDTEVEPGTGLTFRDALQGKSAYLTSSQARQSWAMQNAPIIPGADAGAGVDDILSDFFVDQNADRARSRLQELRASGTDAKSRREIRQALEKVSVFQRVTSSKAEGETRKKMNDAIRQLKTEIPAPLTSFGKRMADKKRLEGERRIREAVSEGRDPVEEMKSYLGEIKRQGDSPAPLDATPKDKALLKLLEE